MAAYNEEKVIIGTVQNLLAIEYDNFNIYVINDGSTDKTLDLLLHNFQSNKRVKIISKINEGKASALNKGLKYSNAEFVVFIDAETRVKPDILQKIINYYKNEEIAAISGHLRVRNVVNNLTSCQNMEYLTLLNYERELLERVNVFTTIPGAICSFRRKELIDVGCFKCEMVTEDCDVTIKFLKAGLKIKNAKNIVGHTEAPESMSMFIRQRVRWDFGLIQNLLKHGSDIFEHKNRSIQQIWFIIAYSWLYKIIYKVLIALSDVIFLATLIFGYTKVHTFYIIFLVLESILFLYVLLRENSRINTKSLLLIFYRIYYRQLLFVALINAIMKISLGQKDIWKKITRYTT